MSVAPTARECRAAPNWKDESRRVDTIVPVFDSRVPVVDWRVPVFDRKAHVVDLRVPVSEWRESVFDQRVPVIGYSARVCSESSRV